MKGSTNIPSSDICGLGTRSRTCRLTWWMLADWQAVAGGDGRTQALMAGALTIRTGRLVDRQVGRVETGREKLAERRTRRKEGE